MPESARWLIQKHRYKEATKVLKYVAKLNRREVPDYDVLVAVGEESVGGKRYTFIDLFRTKTYAARTITVMTGW